MLTPDAVLGLQRTIGNRAFNALAKRPGPKETGPLAAQTVPQTPSQIAPAVVQRTIVKKTKGRGRRAKVQKRYTEAWLADIVSRLGSDAMFLNSMMNDEFGDDWALFCERVAAKKDYAMTKRWEAVIARLQGLLGAKFARLNLGAEKEKDDDDYIDSESSDEELDTSDDDDEMIRAYGPPSKRPKLGEQTVPFSFSTQNFEKYGESTEKRAEKIDQEAELLDIFGPDIAVMQEVTRPDLMEADLESNKTFNQQYAFNQGPQYESGTYHEGYPAAFNQATVHFTPGLTYIDPSTQKRRPYSETLPFGKQAAEEAGDENLKQARPNSIWNFHMPVGKNLRPAYKAVGSDQDAIEYMKKHSNLDHRKEQEYTPMQFMNIHTSPGPSTPTINKQIGNIVDDLEDLAEAEPNTMGGGDGYMQKGAKRKWSELTEGDGKFKVQAPSSRTNMKKGELAQIADHFITPKKWRSKQAVALPPVKPRETEGMDEDRVVGESREELLKRAQDEDELLEWEDYDIDHAHVFASAEVPLDPSAARVTNLELFLEGFFQDLYRQNNCLIIAVAEAAGQGRPNKATLKRIRDRLSTERGVALGAFIKANTTNLAIILHELGLHGTINIFNVEDRNHAALPVYVAPPGNGSDSEDLTNESDEDATRPVALEILYSRYHFYAKPGRPQKS